jgi:NAD(P)-dependent dehydrogenase (short-subunit alcohol dehydrogenase family)
MSKSLERNEMAEHFVILGGTAGSGRTLVRALSQRGDRVTLLARHASPEVQQACPGVHFHHADLCNAEHVRSALDEAMAEGGGPSHLVFFQRYRGKGDSWQGELQVSLTATKEIIEHCQDRFDGGSENSVVMVSSVASRFILAEQPVSYHVGKAALAHMMRYYAVTLGPRGIRVNCVSPDAVIKEESRKFYEENHALRGLYAANTPLGRMGTSEDVTNAILFLCSPQAAFITGQDLVIDGGMSLVGHAAVARRSAGQDQLKLTR